MMVSFVAPHVPLIADPIWAEYYQDAQIPRGPLPPPKKPNDVWGARIDDMHKHSQSQLLTDEYVLNGARQYYGMVSLIDQRIGLFAEHFERLGIIFFRSRFDLFFELGEVAIGLRFHFIAGDYLDDLLSIRLCWLRYGWLPTSLLRVNKHRYCGKSGNDGNEL